jgi:cysteine desulfurase/selenocysteine lyase
MAIFASSISELDTVHPSPNRPIIRRFTTEYTQKTLGRNRTADKGFAALDYVQRIGMANITRYEHALLLYTTEGLRSIPGLHLIGTAKAKASVLSFVLDGFRTEDVGTALNREGIAVRAGHHCAQPILRRFGLESTVRASLALYNTCEGVDALVAALWNLKQGRHSSLV